MISNIMVFFSLVCSICILFVQGSFSVAYEEDTQPPLPVVLLFFDGCFRLRSIFFGPRFLFYMLRRRVRVRRMCAMEDGDRVVWVGTRYSGPENKPSNSP